MKRFLLVGLTGGIATGKSTVSAMFAHLGAKVVDADLLAREVVMPGQPAHAQIVKEFGPDVLDEYLVVLASNRLSQKRRLLRGIYANHHEETLSPWQRAGRSSRFKRLHEHVLGWWDLPHGSSVRIVNRVFEPKHFAGTRER